MTNDKNKLKDVLATAGSRKLSINSLMVLLELNEGRKHTVSNMAKLCCVTPAGATAILDGLECKGMIKRVHSKKDRRIIHLRLTNEGRSALGEILAA